MQHPRLARRFVLPVLALASNVCAAEAQQAVDFYGLLNPGVLSVDDGVETTTAFGNNSHAGSRIGVKVTNEVRGGSLLFNFETGLGFRGLAGVDQDAEPDFWDWEPKNIRKFEFIYSSDWGKVYLGQGSMATDGTATVDQSGTDGVGYVAVADMAGSFLFRNGGGDLTGISVGDGFQTLDSGRRFRLRYDTPSFSGLTLAASYGERVTVDDDRTYYDLAAYYDHTLGELDVRAGLGLGFIDDPDGPNREDLSGSVSMLHSPTGLSLTLAGGAQQKGDASYGYIKAGYQRQLISAGMTALSIDYYAGDSFVTKGDSSDAVGFQVAQSFDDQNITAYLAYRSHSYDDDSATSYRDMDAWLLGLKWNF